MTNEEVKSALLEGGDTWTELSKRLSISTAVLKNTELCEAQLNDRDLAELDFSGSDFFGAKLHKTNLKKSSFVDADFSKAFMREAALYKADFSNAILQEADLSDADLSSTNCQGADFRGATLKGVNFDSADLRGANFSHADLRGANFTGANITGAKFHFARVSDANVTHTEYGTVKDMVGLYYGIRGIDATYGNAIFVRDAKDQDYIDTLYEAILRKPHGFIRKLDLVLFRAWGLIDHGRSLIKVAFYAFIIATFYGLIYLMDMTYNWQIMDYSNSAQTWFTPFYYSVVTYTTLGFGDVTADSLFGEIFVISEVILGYFTLGLLLAILANTIARRS
ncbi:hypothetical protein A9Q96_01355 [Rhodobacterales bacterium 52_120_T64]|nr:hypothetical protein A9Q96_01355 [Rhodobacterales bacterium 52_120_T64]